MRLKEIERMCSHLTVDGSYTSVETLTFRAGPVVIAKETYETKDNKGPRERRSLQNVSQTYIFSLHIADS